MNIVIDSSEFEYINTLTTVISLLLSLIVVCLGIAQHRWNKRHNQALIRPFITGMINTDLKKKWSYAIANKGMGTAKLLSMKIVKSNNEITMRELETWLAKSLKRSTVRVGEFNDQYALSPNEKIELVNIVSPNELAAEVDKPIIDNLLSSVVVKVEYCSLLSDKKLTYVSNANLSLFK